MFANFTVYVKKVIKANIVKLLYNRTFKKPLAETLEVCGHVISTFTEIVKRIGLSL